MHWHLNFKCQLLPEHLFFFISEGLIMALDQREPNRSASTQRRLSRRHRVSSVRQGGDGVATESKGGLLGSAVMTCPIARHRGTAQLVFTRPKVKQQQCAPPTTTTQMNSFRSRWRSTSNEATTSATNANNDEEQQLQSSGDNSTLRAIRGHCSDGPHTEP